VLLARPGHLAGLVPQKVFQVQEADRVTTRSLSKPSRKREKE